MITAEKSTINAQKNMEKIVIDMPQSDMTFMELLADKMGWTISSQQMLWDKYIKNCPKNVDLSDDEIMEAVREVRYAEKMQNNY